MNAAAGVLAVGVAAPSLLVVPVLPRLVGAFGTADGDLPRHRVPAAWMFAVAAVALVSVVTVAMYRYPGRLPAFLYLALAGLVLAIVDWRVRRLPDAIVLPSYPILAALLGLATLVEDAPGRWMRAVAAAGAVWLLHALLAAVPGGGLGRGDVKLAGLLGGALGWLGWPSVALGMVATTSLGGLSVSVLLATRRVSRRDSVAYGPFLLGGGLVAVLASAASAG